jgi:hypothetical protein
MQEFENFELKFTSKEVATWSGLTLLKKMLETMNQWQLPHPGSNRGYAPDQLTEQRLSASAVPAASPKLRPPAWMPHWCASLVGRVPQVTKPSCVCSSALTSNTPVMLKPIADAGWLPNGFALHNTGRRLPRHHSLG